MPLIDHHVHGCWLQSGDRARFENGLNEANTEPLADFDSSFDTQLGFAVRAHCAPVLDLPSHVDADAYWDRRCELGEHELARRFLSAAGVTDWLVDTGFSSGVADLAEMAEVSGGRTHEIVRLESVAEEAAAAPGDYAAAFERILAERAAYGGWHQVDPGLPRRIRGRPVGTDRHRGGRSGGALACCRCRRRVLGHRFEADDLVAAAAGALRHYAEIGYPATESGVNQPVGDPCGRKEPAG